MRSKKLAAVAVAAALVASTAIPSFATSAPVSNAAPAFRPNVAVTYIFAGTISVIFDAIYVAATQCRELTAQEAATATILPVVGGIYNASQPSASKCKK